MMEWVGMGLNLRIGVGCNGARAGHVGSPGVGRFWRWDA